MTTPKAIAEEAADVLTMLASQIREAVAGKGDYPSPWSLEDCVSEYRYAHKELMTPNAGNQR